MTTARPWAQVVDLGPALILIGRTLETLQSRIIASSLPEQEKAELARAALEAAEAVSRVATTYRDMLLGIATGGDEPRH